MTEVFTAGGSSLDLVRQAVATICRTSIETLDGRTRPSDVKGWDSFGRLQVVLEIERLTGRDLPLERAFAASSVGELADVVSELTA